MTKKIIVWKFKKDFPDIWKKSGEQIIKQIDTEGRCFVLYKRIWNSNSYILN